MKNIDSDNEVVIIDYKLGNLFSVKHACIHVGLKPVVTSEKSAIAHAKAIILPGVGAFGDAMRNLEKLDIIGPLIDHVRMRKPIFGICLGMQLLFQESEEFGSNKGLGLIEGVVKKFPNKISGNLLRVPHVGWNTIYAPERSESFWEKTPLDNLDQFEYMYFVHSYYTEPANSNQILSLTRYQGFEYCSSVKKFNIFAIQFHPEKSGIKGLEIYKNFKKIIYDSK